MALATFNHRAYKDMPVNPSISQSNPAAAFSPAGSASSPGSRREEFVPVEPASIDALGVPPVVIEGLVQKFLLSTGSATGRQISDQIKLPYGPANDLLRRMKTEQLVAHRRAAGVNDFEYELTPQGMDRSRRLFEQGSYFGAAPVALEDYVRSVTAQSPTRDPITAAGLQRALGDLAINRTIFSRLGQAMTSVGAMFLYGAPGNGKTSIAERLTAAFGTSFWIPRAVYVEGEIVRLFDPNAHEALGGAAEDSEGTRLDRRWIRIRRPTVVVGGELTMESLDLRMNKATGCVEAPVHMKSNGGTLVIDDFGRQRMGTHELLNRWIVPLEKRYDYLNTPSGKKIQIPFDQLIVFATNLDPSDLVDEAFLRRIPYKIEVQDPTEAEFRHLFRAMAAKQGVRSDDRTIDRLIELWYRPTSRPFRYCQPRDLLRQVSDYCKFHGHPLEATDVAIDAAAQNYFAVMSASLMSGSTVPTAAR